MIMGRTRVDERRYHEEAEEEELAETWHA